MEETAQGSIGNKGTMVEGKGEVLICDVSHDDSDDGFFGHESIGIFIEEDGQLIRDSVVLVLHEQDQKDCRLIWKKN